MGKSRAVMLTRYEIYLAGMVGFQRTLSSMDYKNRQVLENAGFGWNTDIEAACGELAVAKYLGLYWDGSVNTFKQPDVGNLQVRHTETENGRLVVRKKDNENEKYILVTGKSPNFLVRGWLWGREAKVDQFFTARMGKVVSPCWAVPQNELKPIDTINDEPFSSDKSQIRG